MAFVKVLYFSVLNSVLITVMKLFRLSFWKPLKKAISYYPQSLLFRTFYKRFEFSWNYRLPDFPGCLCIWELCFIRIYNNNHFDNHLNCNLLLRAFCGNISPHFCFSQTKLLEEMGFAKLSHCCSHRTS